jgi:hypothetical protein
MGVIKTECMRDTSGYGGQKKNVHVIEMDIGNTELDM